MKDAPAWYESAPAQRIAEILARTGAMDDDALDAEIDRLIGWNAAIHDRDCINLNPATNVMNPRAEAVLSQGLGCRPSLGHPGAKYEMGLEAIEEIEVIATALACEVFQSAYAELRVASGALSNLYAFMACCKPGDNVIVPPAAVAGHVTHHGAGAAGLYGLEIHEAPIDAERYTVDLDGLRDQARRLRPTLITIGGSLNILPHPVAEIRAIADEVGAKVLFDAAHLCGMFAGRQWPDPLGEGADLMTMSTYKSLGGPAGGLIVTNDAGLARRLDAIAFPGLTANFDAGRVAAMAMSLLDWRAHGQAYAEEMAVNARTLSAALYREGLPVFFCGDVATRSHQFALEAAAFGGGQTVSHHLRKANLLACGIGLPVAPVDGDMNGLRIGTPEITRRGMAPEHMGELANLIARAVGPNPEAVAPDVTAYRQRFQGLHFIRK